MNSSDKTSSSLLERVRADDQGAWQRLLRLYTPLVQHWCQRCGVQGADADDVCQEVFRSVAAKVAAFHHDRQGDTFRGWLRVITRHKILDHHRRARHQPVGEGGTDAHERILGVAEQELLADDTDEETTNLYHRALELVRGEFEDRTWEAFWRAAVQGHRPDVIAADLGVTPAAIRKAKSRVLLRLRQELGDLII